MITILAIGPESIATTLEQGDFIARRLEMGAGDYVVRPCSSRELAAQIRVILRPSTLSVEQTICFGDVEVNFERRYIRRHGEEVKMTPAEYNLLAFFLRNVDRPLTRAAILNQVWGYNVYPNTRTVDAHVVKLRQKLEPDPSAPRHFLTIHRVGYRFMMNPS